MQSRSGSSTPWQPPPRPEWVTRLNEEGACMDMRGVVPLDEDSLIESAMRATGLSDFGSDDWREPFRILVRSLEDEAELNLMGRVRTRSELLLLLEARLQIEDTYKRHPEINDEEIRQPIFVVGQGRSGTSFLINLLAADPDNGAMRQWEAFFPCPPPEQATYASDPRIARADRLIKQWYRVTPTMEAMHEFGGNIPFECNQVFALSFRTLGWFDALGQVASYDQYILGQDLTPALRYQERLLKLLQWKNPRRHWVLKDPLMLDLMETTLKVHPDACFVWTHRDPVRALASAINLIGTLQWGRSDHPFKGGSFEYVTDPSYSAQRLDAVVDRLDAGAVPPRQIFHVLYRDLVGDTLPTIEAMYRHFGLPFSKGTRAAMAEYLLRNPRDARPVHRFDGGSAGTIAEARGLYRRYQDRFAIPDE